MVQPHSRSSYVNPSLSFIRCISWSLYMCSLFVWLRNHCFYYDQAWQLSLVIGSLNVGAMLLSFIRCDFGIYVESSFGKSCQHGWHLD